MMKMNKQKLIAIAAGALLHARRHAAEDDMAFGGASSDLPKDYEDEVDLASLDSFPCSDPPAWTNVRATACQATLH